MHGTFKERAKLADRTIGPIRHLNSFIGAWLRGLVAPSTDGSVWTRTNIFFVYVYGLLDAIADCQSRMDQLERDMEQTEIKYAVLAANYLRLYNTTLSIYLSVFTNEELIYISECRHQICHGRLDEFYKDSRRHFKIKNYKVERIKTSKELYWDVYNSFQRETKDDSLIALKLREKIYPRKTMAYVLYSDFNTPKFLDQINRGIMMNFQSLINDLPSDIDYIVESEKRGASLLDLRGYFVDDVNDRPDPFFKSFASPQA